MVRDPVLITVPSGTERSAWVKLTGRTGWGSLGRARCCARSVAEAKTSAPRGDRQRIRETAGCEELEADLRER